MTKWLKSQFNIITSWFANDLTLFQRGIFVVSVPFVIQALFLFYYSSLLSKSQNLALHEYRSKAIVGHANWLSMVLLAATDGLLAYTLTANEKYRTLCLDCLSTAPSALSQMDGTLNDERAEFLQAFKRFQSSAVELERLLRRELLFLKPTKMSRSLGVKDEPAMEDAWRQFYANRRALLAEDRSSSASVTTQDMPSSRNLIECLTIVGLGLNIVLALALLWVYNNQIAQKLLNLRKNAQRLKGGMSLAPLLKGRDEISVLDQTFHEMAKEIEIRQQKLERNEAYLQNLIDNLPVGLISVDRDGQVKSANRRVQEIFGWNKEKFVDVQLHEIFPIFTKDVIALSDPDGSVHAKPIEATVCAESGEELVVEFELKNYEFYERTLLLGTIHDITERRKLEAMRQSFLNMVSHDLRSPLTGIRLSQELLIRGAFGALPEQALETLTKSNKSVTRLVTLINDLLDLEKLQSGKLEMRPSLNDLSSAVELAFEALKPIAQNQNVLLEERDTAHKMWVDQERLTQVLINLLANAIKFSPEGTAVVVSATSLSDFVRVAVSDSGPGVPKDEQISIFEKFSQSKGNGGGGKSGTGLGLPICQEIVERWGGKIGIENAPGELCTFWFTVPKSAR